mmetsp:Transcript_24271/g.33933  ORF Transcript_24271/g.33933 Transcript_24271/m.33933 type:complete len:90 (-) Transcript_24271:257-526(-)
MLKDVKEWTVEEVGAFIRARSNAPAWERIADMFIEEELDGSSLVEYYDNIEALRNDYKSLKPHQARKIVNSITSFKPSQASKDSFQGVS